MDKEGGKGSQNINSLLKSKRKQNHPKFSAKQLKDNHTKPEDLE